MSKLQRMQDEAIDRMLDDGCYCGDDMDDEPCSVCTGISTVVRPVPTVNELIEMDYASDPLAGYDDSQFWDLDETEFV